MRPLRAEEVIACQGGGVDADAAVHVGLVELGEIQFFTAGDADGVHLGKGPVAEHHLAFRPAVVPVEVPSGAEAAADEQRAAQDDGHDLSGPALFGLDLHGSRGLGGLEAFAVGTIAVVVFVVASVLVVVIIVIHRNCLPVEISALRAGFGARLPLMVLGYRGFMSEV